MTKSGNQRGILKKENNSQETKSELERKQRDEQNKLKGGEEQKTIQKRR